MKQFECLEINEAVDYAMAGGQALHLHRIIVDPDSAPSCFVRAVNAGKDIAHLFDQNLRRLEMTTRQLGVRIVVVEGKGTKYQHTDLCLRPLELAKQVCKLMKE